MKIKIKIPASSANLGSGFDCLSVALNLYNFYEFETHTKEIKQSYTSDISQFSLKEDLVEKAYLKNCQQYGLETIPFHLHCYAQIPSAIGLGSSANAVLAGVLLAKIVHKRKIDKAEVLQDALVLENHPDNIASCLYGGFNISILKNKQLKNNQLKNKQLKKNSQQNNAAKNFHYPITEKLHCIFLQLNGTSETKENRRQLPKEYSSEDVVFNLGRSALTAAAFVSQNFPLLKEGTQDRLHQPYRFRDNLAIADLEQKLLGEDFFGLALSGSGPSLIVFCSVISQRILCVLDEYFSAKKEDFKLMHLKIDNQGAVIES